MFNPVCWPWWNNIRRALIGFLFDDRISGGRDVFTMAPGAVADRIGRRPVMLAGVVWFIVTVWQYYWRKTLNNSPCCASCRHKPLFHWRCGIRRNSGILRKAVCIKITALMANVALIAPLLVHWWARRGSMCCPGKGCLSVCRIGSDLLFRSATSHA